MHITFVRAKRLAPDLIEFWFRPERPVQFVPGQFADFQLPHSNPDARGDSRQFSFTSLPSESLISIVVRFPKSPSSYKRALFTMAPGTTLHLGEPLGDFVLPKVPSVPLAWIAGGVGCAAFVSMAKQLIDSREKRSVTCLQSARHSEELLFVPTWRAAGLTLTQTVTGEDDTWSGRRERFSTEEILATMPKSDDALFYVSGTDQMVEEICSNLISRGIQREQLVREAFTGY
jgi:ferredoxin-NADP reductase